MAIPVTYGAFMIFRAPSFLFNAPMMAVIAFPHQGYFKVSFGIYLVFG
jgi:hypothetical protein